MKKLSANQLTDNQTVLVYAALIIGHNYKQYANGGVSNFVTSVASRIVNYQQMMSEGRKGSFDCLHLEFTADEIKFMRKALSGGRFGDYESGLIAGMFNYAAFN